MMKKSDFHYVLPESLIAQQPLDKRDSSRMLLVDSASNRLGDQKFTDFVDLLQPEDLLVFNNTKVIAARLYGKKQTGGKVEILIERITNDFHAIAHVKASKSPKPGAVIELDGDFNCTILARKDDLFELEFNNNATIHEVLQQIGHIPLPPYIEREDNKADRERYQTVFAENLGAVAAPTAGLHFSQKILDKITDKGIRSVFVTLHVGSGTFQPVRVENLDEHLMHKEYFEVSESVVLAVEQTRKRGGRVIAIGTTSVRALESASVTGSLKAGMGDTDLFITPGYQFRSVDAMLTNFHLPESTLLMLVSAFAGYERIMKAYQHAIENEYRFFSYGDAMFILRAVTDADFNAS
jgi:S-adenosylmethionine:tRNA ribosyltransferase-isomerase